LNLQAELKDQRIVNEIKKINYALNGLLGTHGFNFKNKISRKESKHEKRAEILFFSL